MQRQERNEREMTGPFWEAVDRGVLMRPVCNSCEASFFTPQVVCPRCQSPDWEYRPSSGNGHIYSHTTVHRAPDDRFEAPYVVADVEMDEGWRLLTWIVGCDPAAVQIGMEVEVSFVIDSNGESLPAFAPAGSNA